MKSFSTNLFFHSICVLLFTLKKTDAQRLNEGIASSSQQRQLELTALTDDNFQFAVDKWYDDPAMAMTQYGHIEGWDTSAITDMSGAFIGKLHFNDMIGGWNTASVTTFFQMFHYAKAFNQDIGDWITSEVTDMRWMFHVTDDFNQDISKWNTDKVTDMALVSK
jgi:surface protein